MVNVPECINELRQSRISMVQTKVNTFAIIYIRNSHLQTSRSLSTHVHWTCQSVGCGVGTSHEGLDSNGGERVGNRVNVVINGGVIIFYLYDYNQ